MPPLPEGLVFPPKAFSAHLNMTSESLPPENSRVGRSNAAATSRKMKMVSSSNASRWALLRVCNSGCVMAFISFSGFVFVGACLLAMGMR